MHGSGTVKTPECGVLHYSAGDSSRMAWGTSSRWGDSRTTLWTLLIHRLRVQLDPGSLRSADITNGLKLDKSESIKWYSAILHTITVYTYTWHEMSLLIPSIYTEIHLITNVTLTKLDLRVTYQFSYQLCLPLKIAPDQGNLMQKSVSWYLPYFLTYNQISECIPVWFYICLPHLPRSVSYTESLR